MSSFKNTKSDDYSSHHKKIQIRIEKKKIIKQTDDDLIAFILSRRYFQIKKNNLNKRDVLKKFKKRITQKEIFVAQVLWCGEKFFVAVPKNLKYQQMKAAPKKNKN